MCECPAAFGEGRGGRGPRCCTARSSGLRRNLASGIATPSNFQPQPLRTRKEPGTGKRKGSNFKLRLTRRPDRQQRLNVDLNVCTEGRQEGTRSAAAKKVIPHLNFHIFCPRLPSCLPSGGGRSMRVTPAAWERPRPHPALPSKLASERSKEGKREGRTESEKKERGTKEKRIFSCAPSPPSPL